LQSGTSAVLLQFGFHGYSLEPFHRGLKLVESLAIVVAVDIGRGFTNSTEVVPCQSDVASAVLGDVWAGVAPDPSWVVVGLSLSQSPSPAPRHTFKHPQPRGDDEGCVNAVTTWLSALLLIIGSMPLMFL